MRRFVPLAAVAFLGLVVLAPTTVEAAATAGPRVARSTTYIDPSGLDADLGPEINPNGVR